jgi:hypothetical protein
MPPRTKTLKRAHKAAAAEEEEKEEGPNKRAHTEKFCPTSDEEDSESMAESGLGLRSLTQQASEDGPRTPDDYVSPPTPTPSPEDHTSAAAATADVPLESLKAPVSPGVGAAHASTVPSPFVLNDYVRFKDDPAGERFHVRGGKRDMVYIDADDGLGFVASACRLEKVPIKAVEQREKIEPHCACCGYLHVNQQLVLVDYQQRPQLVCRKCRQVCSHCLRDFKRDLPCVRLLGDKGAWWHFECERCYDLDSPDAPAPPPAAASTAPPPPPLKRQPSVRRFMKCEECHKRKPDVHEVCGGGWVVCNDCRFSSEED